MVGKSNGEQLGAFIWGAGGAKLTPEQIAIRRIANQKRLAGGVDTSPVQHWTQGAARVAEALADVVEQRRLATAQTESDTYNTDLVNSILGGAATASSSASAASAPVDAPVIAGEPASAPTVDISGSKQDFVNALLPAAIEEGHRTGVDPRIIVAQAAQETGWGRSAPNNNYFGIKSHGQSGGSTMMTHEYVDGKRVNVRDSFRGYASPADSVRGYGDFILQNPRYGDLRAAQGLDAQLAALQASGYATDPNYSRSVGAIARGIQVPEAMPSSAPETAFRDPLVNAQGAQAAIDTQMAPQVDAQPMAPELPPPTTIAPSPAVAQVAQSMPSAPQQQSGGVNQALIRALSDPRANDQTRAIAEILIRQDQARQQAAQEQAVWQQRQEYERQQQANDPLRQLQIQKAQQDVEQGRNPQRPLINSGDGRLYDPNKGEWIVAPDSANRNFRAATPDEVKVFGTNGQVGPDGRFYPVTPPQGTALSVDPNTGAVSFNQGPGVKPLTEAQSKDSFFTTRMTAATPTIDKFEDALMSLPEAAAGVIPLNLGRYAQSEEYQLAKDAGRDFVNAYLRKDSGAALTQAEEENYGQLLLPQPGDKPAIIDAKRQRRQIAVEAIKSGMPPSAVDGMLRAIKSVPGADQPAQTTSEKKTSTGVQWSLD